MYNICFITPNLGKGGMERVISILSNTLVEKNYYVTIITLINNHVEYEFNERIKVIHLNDIFKGGITAKISILWKLIKTLKKLNPNVVLSFSEVFNPLSIIACKLNNLKIYISDRSNPLMNHKLRDIISRKLIYPIANGILAQTELAKSIFIKKHYNSNILVLPNPIIEFKNNNINFAKKTVISVGRLITSKNHKELIDIFSEINMKDWELIIVGDGELRATLENYISSKNLNEKILLPGKSDKIEEWLDKGSIFAFTSLSEGFPNALNEAMAYPLACIAYDCPAGVSDLIINNVNGYLIPIKNKNLYREKLEELMYSEKVRQEFMMQGIKNRDKYNRYYITDMLLEFIL